MVSYDGARRRLHEPLDCGEASGTGARMPPPPGAPYRALRVRHRVGFDPAHSDLDFVVTFQKLGFINMRTPTSACWKTCRRYFSARWMWWLPQPLKTPTSARRLSPRGHWSMRIASKKYLYDIARAARLAIESELTRQRPRRSEFLDILRKHFSELHPVADLRNRT